MRFWKPLLVSAALGSLVICVPGCGGLLSTNSTILIHLKQNPLLTQPTTQVMTNYELYVTSGGLSTVNLANPNTFATTQNDPSGLLDNYVATRSSSTEIDIQFTTRSSEVPYYVFVGVPAESTNTDTVGLEIDVDASTGAVKPFTVPTGTYAPGGTPSGPPTQFSSEYYPTPQTGINLLVTQINRNSAVY